MTVRESPKGRHATPKRGLKLFLSVRRSDFGNPASAAVTNGVFGTDLRTKSGTSASPSSSETMTRPPGKSAIEVAQLVRAIEHRRPQIVTKADVDRQRRCTGRQSSWTKKP